MGSDTDVTCPFCGDTGFDLIGLKSHLFRWCETFDAIESLSEERDRKAKESEAQ